MNKLTEPYNVVVEALDTPTHLSLETGASEAWHQWSQQEVQAVVQAWASERPLLVRGEAGCGKSQLARALAHLLKVPFIQEVIHPRYEATDLLYKDDPVERLAQAQLIAATRPAQSVEHTESVKQLLDPAKFVTDGPLLSAMRQPPPPNKPQEWPRAVVLIDEIDKADSDLPNALLAVFGDRSFVIHPTGQRVCIPLEHRPLIVVTTNEDRELPAAFVRRCTVLNMKPADQDRSAFVDWLRSRAAAHRALSPLIAGDGDDEPDILIRAAEQVWADREAARRESLPTVGLAEYLDLLYSLNRLAGGNSTRAGELLDQLSPYALVKHRDQDQARRPASPDEFL